VPALPIDATEIAPRLWQGSVPPRGPALRRLGFDTLVLTAQEIQNPAAMYPGLRVIHVPLVDRREVPVDEAHRAAQAVAAEVRAGRKVLVTCFAGWNRSGLVTALALWYLTGWHGQRVLQHVQARRPVSLQNHYFAQHVASMLPQRLDGRGGRARRLAV
jgi:protein-tyrosine phosphatase